MNLARIIIVLSLASILAAQDTPPSLSIKQLEGSKHALGAIEFDTEKRTIRFPAMVNMDEGAIEFALVGSLGKTHEAILSTDIRPMQLRTVLSLMHFEPSPPQDAEASPPQTLSKVEIDLHWETDSGKKTSVSLRKCIAFMEFERVSQTGEKVHLQPLPKGYWIYTGSRLDDLGLEAERELDIIGVERRMSALFNLPDRHTDQDDLWQAYGEALPAKGTPLVIEIQLPPRPKG